MSIPFHQEQHQLLSSDTQDMDTPLRSIVTPPQSSAPRHRPGYARAPSVSFVDERLIKRAMEGVEDDITQASREPAPSGLGINVGQNTAPKTPHVTSSTIRRVPVGTRSASEQQTPDSSKPLISPPSTDGLSGSTHYDPGFDQFEYYPKHVAKQSVSSLQSMNAPSLSQNSERNLLPNALTASVHQQFREFEGRHMCHSSRHFKRGMNNWLALTIVLLSIFSTFFSGAFLIIALHKPRYGDRIGTHGTLTVSTAAFLTSLFAKMIELSFITCVVAFIGQLLARRAFQKEPNPGVTLAEISMRSWIVQPGTMLTHWESVRYAAPSLLGLTALIAAIMAMLYTPASTALVQPQLKFGGWEHLVLQGDVFASFANENYLEQNCKTPITLTIDDNTENITTTCIEIEHASESFHNYQRWLGDWTDFARSGNGTRSLETRPKGWALLMDNTTVTAPWIEQTEQGQYKNTKWFINNVTMAMPHPGVVSAAINPANGIQQPDELNGLGIYSVRASVPVPFVNVICLMGMTEGDLKPLVYSEWDEAKKLDTGTWPEQLSKVDSYIKDPFLGGTPFDDVFKWGEKYGWNNWPPIFAKLPMDYNTLINDTTGVPLWGRNAVYVLGKGGPVDITGVPTDYNYGLCELRVGQTPNCSTQYNASSNVGTLEAICEDPHDDMRYIKSLKNASTGMAALSADWPNIASMWLRSIDLASGQIDGNASNARLWTELILTNTSVDYSIPEQPMALQMAFPSPAEALSVMAGCTLLQSAQDGPFAEFWNYSVAILDEPQLQYFNASVRAQEYASGGLPGYQQVFNIVLFGVFLINVIVLLYFFVHRDWYTDFSDPTHLFSLAINSPPSEKLADCSCGQSQSGGEKFKHYWKLENHGGHVSIESPDIHEMGESPTLKKRFSDRFETITSPVVGKITSPVTKAVGRWRRKSPDVNNTTDQLYRT